jgi:hypothetical protein
VEDKGKCYRYLVGEGGIYVEGKEEKKNRTTSERGKNREKKYRYRYANRQTTCRTN